jgi:peptide/nickel transport system substrate-binding protein
VRSRRSAVALVALLIGLALSLGAERAPGTSTLSGGTLTFASPLSLAQISLDPALALVGHKPFYYATCATLMAFRDAPAPKGFTVRLEAAAGAARVSRGGRRYVFTVRKGLRFSDGSPLTAANFARALGRVLNPVMRSPGASIFSDVRRVSASGRRLHIDLNKPSGDLSTRLALPYACPVPLGFPIDPAGVDLTVGSGPYYVRRSAPNQLLLLRNRYYRGGLPHRVEKIVGTFGGNLDDNIRAVEHGQADVLLSEIPGDVRKLLAQRYGIDRRQLFRQRGLYTTALILNTSSPLFRGNVPLRKAVNFALDRPGVIAQTLGGPLSNPPTDEIVPSRSPGWIDYHLYPLAGPDLAGARRLAAGHLRGGTAVLYTPADRLRPAMASVIADDLAKIGLKVEIKQFAAAVMMAKVGTRGEPFDMVLGNWGDDLLGPSLPDLEPPLVYPDPANVIVRYLGGENARKPSGNANVAYFDLRAYNRRMAADARLSGPPRFRAFSRLDADIMRNQAPWAPIAEGSSWYFVSRRVGCVHLRPVVSLVWGDLCPLG